MSQSCSGVTNGSSRSRGPGPGLPCCTAPCGSVAPVCPALPCVPDQGAVMPVLYNPGSYTNYNNTSLEDPIVYTLNLVTTAPIPVGILLRFQMYDGVNLTYAAADASGGIAQWDLVVSRAIPIATIVVVAVTATQTSIVDFSGSLVYASGGAGVLSAFLSVSNSLLCWAYAPTAQGSWTPATGQPQFAIGFQWPITYTGGPAGVPQLPCAGAPNATTQSSPNFPDQWCTTSGITWTFLYEIVFPTQHAVVDGELVACFPVTGIKIQAQGAGDVLSPLYVTAEWSTLRDIIAQPWTVFTPTIVSPSRWVTYDFVGGAAVADVGPFILAAAAGQLAVVYFQPRHLNIQSTGTYPASGGDWSSPARLGLLVVSPLPANTTLYFTTEPYNSYAGGFGPRQPQVNAPATFIVHAPSFIWVTGSCVIPAGTVVFIDNIGSATDDPIVVDAHDTGSHKVGSIVSNTVLDRAVPSITIVSDWVQYGTGAARPLEASRFVTGAYSDQYTGDEVPLSPMLTVQRTRAHGAVAYGLGRVFDNTNLPGTVQAAVINSATLTNLSADDAAAVTATDMPVFTGMTPFKY